MQIFYIIITAKNTPKFAKITAMFALSHKIELQPNNKAKTHFKKAFGCARLAYNWGLAKWKETTKRA